MSTLGPPLSSYVSGGQSPQHRHENPSAAQATASYFHLGHTQPARAHHYQTELDTSDIHSLSAFSHQKLTSNNSHDTPGPPKLAPRPPRRLRRKFIKPVFDDEIGYDWGYEGEDGRWVMEPASASDTGAGVGGSEGAGGSGKGADAGVGDRDRDAYDGGAGDRGTQDRSKIGHRSSGCSLGPSNGGSMGGMGGIGGIGVNRGSGLGYGNGWVMKDRVDLDTFAADYWARAAGTGARQSGEGCCRNGVCPGAVVQGRDAGYGVLGLCPGVGCVVSRCRWCPCGSVIRGYRGSNSDCTPECCRHLQRRRDVRRGFYRGRWEDNL